MSEQRDSSLRSEDVADATSSGGAAEPAEERLAAASPDDAAGAATGGDAQADAAAEGAAAAAADSGRPLEDRDGPPAGDAGAGPAGAADDGGGAVDDAQEPDFRDQYVRALAELDNVRKRLTRQAGLAETRGVVKLAKEVLPALDDLERALEVAPGDDPMRDGVRIVHERLIASLAKVGIEPDAPKGERFDPHLHEALAQHPVEGVASGTIVEVYSNGYRLGDEVLRAAKVVVAA